MAKSDSSGKFHRRQLRSGVDKEPWQYSVLSRTLRINRKIGKSVNRNEHQNRETEVFWHKNRKTDLKNSQNRKTGNPNAPPE